MKYRKIIHLDLDAFFCAVEELNNPQLKGKAFAVGGNPEGRGVVSSCSYAARSKGVHSAMPMVQAIKLCPELIVVHGTYYRYTDASKSVMRIINDLTPLVEQISIDEAFLDVSDLPQKTEVIARKLQSDIVKETRLPSSLGVASNKLVAKIANDVGKKQHKGNDYPRAVTIVEPGKEAEFLAPLPVELMWGVGAKTNKRLRELGIRTIKDLAEMDVRDLQQLFGKMGLFLSRHAKGIDDRSVESFHGRKSISQERTFMKDVGEKVVVEKKINELSEQIAFLLRQKGFFCSTIRLKLRWSDFTTITRQISLKKPTDLESEIYKHAIELLDNNWQVNRKVRLIGVGVSGLSERVLQLSLWDGPDEKERKLTNAIDGLRNKYGKQIIYKGKTLKAKK